MKKNKFIISDKTKIIQVLKKFNSNGYKSVLVANENNVLIGYNNCNLGNNFLTIGNNITNKASKFLFYNGFKFSTC